MRQLATEKILGYDIVSDSADRCFETIRGWIETGEKSRVFVCANPHSLVLAEDDPGLKAALRAADMATPDGMGIVLASRILGGTITERVTGSDVFAGLSRALSAREEKTFGYFFLGSTDATLAVIRSRLARDFPKIRFAGSYSPPFKAVFSDEDSRKMVDAVNQAAPDVLWVGMTAPKQEKWIYRNKDSLNVKFIGAIGAVFDFYAGNVRRSHPWFLEHGLEWLPRLFQEPRRLWQRTFISAPRFFFRVFLQKIGDSH